jgi:hypothetical protein
VPIAGGSADPMQALKRFQTLVTGDDASKRCCKIAPEGCCLK